MFRHPRKFHPRIVSNISFKQPLYFLAQLHTWNAYRSAPYGCNDACCSKSVQRTVTQASEALLSTELYITVNCLNSAFPHPHYCNQSAFLNHCYLPFYFWQIVLKHPAYLKESELWKFASVAIIGFRFNL